MLLSSLKNPLSAAASTANISGSNPMVHTVKRRAHSKFYEEEEGLEGSVDSGNSPILCTFESTNSCT